MVSPVKKLKQMCIGMEACSEMISCSRVAYLALSLEKAARPDCKTDWAQCSFQERLANLLERKKLTVHYGLYAL